MPEADLDVVRRLIDAMAGDDEEATRAACHPEIEWHLAEYFVEAAILRGREQVIDFLRRFQAEWDELHPVLDSVEERRGTIVASGRLVGRAAATGIELEAARTWLLDVRDGMVWRWRSYNTKEEALAALEEG